MRRARYRPDLVADDPGPSPAEVQLGDLKAVWDGRRLSVGGMECMCDEICWKVFRARTAEAAAEGRTPGEEELQAALSAACS